MKWTLTLIMIMTGMTAGTLSAQDMPDSEIPVEDSVTGDLPWFKGFVCRTKDLHSGYLAESTAWTVPAAAALSMAACHAQAELGFRLCVPYGCFPEFE